MNQSKPKFRDRAQQMIYVVIHPLVKFLIKLGLTPNAVTLIGLVLNILVTAIFIEGAEKGNRGELSYIGWAGAMVLFAGVFEQGKLEKFLNNDKSEDNLSSKENDKKKHIDKEISHDR